MKCREEKWPSVCWFISKRPRGNTAGPGQTWEPVMQSACPTWLTRIQLCEPSPHASQIMCEQEQSQDSDQGTPIWDVGAGAASNDQAKCPPKELWHDWSSGLGHSSFYNKMLQLSNLNNKCLTLWGGLLLSYMILNSSPPDILYLFPILAFANTSCNKLLLHLLYIVSFLWQQTREIDVWKK